MKREDRKKNKGGGGRSVEDIIIFLILPIIFFFFPSCGDECLFIYPGDLVHSIRTWSSFALLVNQGARCQLMLVLSVVATKGTPYLCFEIELFYADYVLRIPIFLPFFTVIDS